MNCTGKKEKEEERFFVGMLMNFLYKGRQRYGSML